MVQACKFETRKLSGIPGLLFESVLKSGVEVCTWAGWKCEPCITHGPAQTCQDVGNRQSCLHEGLQAAGYLAVLSQMLSVLWPWRQSVMCLSQKCHPNSSKLAGPSPPPPPPSFPQSSVGALCAMKLALEPIQLWLVECVSGRIEGGSGTQDIMPLMQLAFAVPEMLLWLVMSSLL